MPYKQEKISQHVPLWEAMGSSTAERLGIDNTPPDEIKEVMKVTANAVFEPVRNHFGVPIAITSFFRCEKLNAALSKNPKVQASKKSQHRLGEAMDIDAHPYGRVTNRQIFDYICENLEFDQLIWEEGTDEEPEWVHVSYVTPSEKRKNRKQVLRKFRKDGKTWYDKYDTAKQ